MNDAAAAVFVQLAIAVVVQLGVSLALWQWGKSIASRRTGRFWRGASWAPLAGFVLALTGMTLTGAVLIRTFGRVSQFAPESKAAQLANGISLAMNVTACFAVPSITLYLGSAVIFFIGWLKPSA